MTEKNISEYLSQHDKKILSIEYEIDRIKSHERDFNKFKEETSKGLNDMSLQLQLINSRIANYADTQSRIRALEDKSLFVEALNKIAWIVIGAVTMWIINNRLLVPTNKEENQYNIEKHK